MQPFNLIAARTVLERHQKMIDEADRYRALRQAYRGRPSVFRRRLAASLASWAIRLDPEQTAERRPGIAG